jgi:hypothetical protein
MSHKSICVAAPLANAQPDLGLGCSSGVGATAAANRLNISPSKPGGMGHVSQIDLSVRQLQKPGGALCLMSLTA